MADNIIKLRKRAKSLGVDSKIVQTGDRSALEKAIRKAESNSNGDAPAKKKKGAVKKAVGSKTKKKTSTTKAKNSSSRKANKQEPAESRKKSGKAKRPASASSKRKSNSNSDDSGRHLIGNIDWKGYDTDDWKPRDTSVTGIIFKALKKFKGDADKTLDYLLEDINDLIPARKRDGSKRSKAEREQALMYRIFRTRFDFAVKTGQHESSTNRIKYGTGLNATERKVTKRKASKPKNERKQDRKGTTRKGKKKSKR